MNTVRGKEYCMSKSDHFQGRQTRVKGIQYKVLEQAVILNKMGNRGFMGKEKYGLEVAEAAGM